MYPCRGVLHTPYKFTHSGQTDRPIWSDSPMCLFVLTSSIHELFTPSNYRSLSGSFVGHMQYAPTRVRKYYAMIRSFRSLPGIVCGAYAIRPYTGTKMLCDNSFFPIPSGIVCGAYTIRPYPTGWKKEVSKCFCDAFWVSKSSQNVLEMLFEAQNRVKMLLRCFLRLKIESKCFCGAFWGSKWSSNTFAVLFEAQNRIKMILRCFLRLKIESKRFWGTFWGSK